MCVNTLVEMGLPFLKVVGGLEEDEEASVGERKGGSETIGDGDLNT